MEPQIALLKRAARYIAREEQSQGLFENALAGSEFKYNRDIGKQLNEVNSTVTNFMKDVREKMILKTLMGVYIAKQSSPLKTYAVERSNFVEVLEDYMGERFDYHKADKLYPEVALHFDIANAALELALEEFAMHYFEYADEIEEQSSYTIPLGSSWLG